MRPHILLEAVIAVPEWVDPDAFLPIRPITITQTRTAFGKHIFVCSPSRAPTPTHVRVARAKTPLTGPASRLATSNNVVIQNRGGETAVAHSLEQGILNLSSRLVNHERVKQTEVMEDRPSLLFAVDQTDEVGYVEVSFIHIQGMVEVRGRSGSQFLPGFVMLRRDARIANRFAAMLPSKY